jgi:beta-mannanase
VELLIDTEDPDPPVATPGAVRVRRLIAPLLLAAALVVLLVVQFSNDRRPAPGQPALPRVSPAGSVDFGVVTGQLALNEYRSWRPADLGSVEAFERDAGKRVSVIEWYADWRHNLTVDLAQLQAVARMHAVPEITWEPWDYTGGLRHPQPGYTLASIVNGAHDVYIRRWAQALAAYGGPVRLRLAQEMNGNWYPWAEGFNGNTAGQFAPAWRHVWRIFHAAGATNVRWVWSQVAIKIKPNQYPGSRYVDIVGLSGFNGGPQLRFGPWRSFDEQFKRQLAALRQVAPRKPIELSEVAVAEQGGSKAHWIEGFFQTLARNPDITSFVWFNVRTTGDWRIETSRTAQRAFAAGVSSARYR